MSVLDEVLKHLDGNTIGAMAKQLGASPQQTQSAIQMALPAILGGMQRNIANGGADALHRAASSQQHQGADLMGMLGGLLGGGGAPSGAGGLLGAVMGMMGGGAQQQSSPLSAGMSILGHVLGGSQQRAAQGVAQASGLSAQGAQSVMAMLAPMVMGALGKMTAGGTGAQGLSQVIGGDLARLGQQSSAAGQKGFLGGLLDADGDGDVDMSDLMNRGSMLMGLFGKR